MEEKSYSLLYVSPHTCQCHADATQHLTPQSHLSYKQGTSGKFAVFQTAYPMFGSREAAGNYLNFFKELLLLSSVLHTEH